MSNRTEIQKRLLRSRREADGHMNVICETVPLNYDILQEQLRQYVLTKFLLTEEDAPADKSFDGLVELSLAKSMKISPELVEEFDTAKSCDGATSAMAKKVLLFMAIQRALKIELPALESARVKTLEDLSSMVWNTLAQQPEWRQKMDL